MGQFSLGSPLAQKGAQSTTVYSFPETEIPTQVVPPWVQEQTRHALGWTNFSVLTETGNGTPPVPMEWNSWNAVTGGSGNLEPRFQDNTAEYTGKVPELSDEWSDLRKMKNVSGSIFEQILLTNCRLHVPEIDVFRNRDRSILRQLQETAVGEEGSETGRDTRSLQLAGAWR